MEDVMMFVGPFIGALVGAMAVVLVRSRRMPVTGLVSASTDPSDARVRAINDVLWATMEGRLSHDGAKAVLEEALWVDSATADRILAAAAEEAEKLGRRR